MKKNELIQELAEIVSGLQAPYSIAPSALGTAGPAWAKVKDGLRLHGWVTKDEVAKALEKVLEER